MPILFQNMVRVKKIGVPKGGLNQLKYQCKVCDVHPLGADIQKHYQSKTNWELLAEMRASVGDQALAQVMNRGLYYSKKFYFCRW